MFLLLLLLFGIQTSSKSARVDVAYGFEMKEDWLGCFQTMFLRNLSISIAPAENSRAPARVIHLSEMKVTTSTQDYSKENFEKVTGIDDTFHKMTKADIHNFVQRRYRLHRGFTPLTAKSFRALAEDVNDTTQASGINGLDEDKASAEDLVAIEEFTTKEATDIYEIPEPDPKYQNMFENLPEEEAWDSYVEDTEEENNANWHISYFDNLEAEMLEVVADIVAANESSLSDEIDPSRISVEDYYINDTDPEFARTDYMWTEEFDNELVKLLDEEVEDPDQDSNTGFIVKGDLKIWGFSIAKCIPVFIDVSEVSGWGLKLPKISKVIKLPSLKVTKPLGKLWTGAKKSLKKDWFSGVKKQCSKSKPFFKNMVKSAGSSYNKYVRNPITKGYKQTKSFVNSVAIKPAKKMVAQAKQGVSDIVEGVKKIPNAPFAAIQGIGKGLSKLIIPLLIGGLILLVALVIGYGIYMKFITGSAKKAYEPL